MMKIHKINKYNVNVQDMKQMGYNEVLIKEAIHSSEKGASYYTPWFDT